MKKHTLLALLPFALVVTGCGSLNKGSIFNEKFMKMNTFEPEVNYEYEIQKEEVLDLGSEVTPVQDAFEEDLLALSKADGSTGYYNLSTRKMAVPVDQWKAGNINVEYTWSGDVVMRFFSAVKEAEGVETLYIYDEYGNLVYSGENGYVILEDEITEDLKTPYRIAIEIDNVLKGYVFYKMDLSFAEVLTLDEYYAKYPYADLGESLLQFGHKNLIEKTVTAYSEKRHSIFDIKKGKFVSTFAIPTNTSGSVIRIGDYYFYQMRNTLQENEKKYDYTDGTNKYRLETYRVNYLNGKVSKIKTNLVFNTFHASSSNLVNEKYVAKYYYAINARMIAKDKTLDTYQHGLILDEKLDTVADITGINFNSLDRFGNYYIGGKTIYDSKLREVGYIDNQDGGSGKRVVKVGGKYGLVDHTGKYILEPVNDSILEILSEKDYYCVSNGDDYKFFKLNEKEEMVEIATLSNKEYLYDTDSASYAHCIYEKVEDHKHYAFNRFDGSFTAMIEPQVGDVDIALCEGYGAMNYTLSTDAHVFQRGSEYRVIYNSTHTTYSLPADFPIK